MAFVVAVLIFLAGLLVTILVAFADSMSTTGIARYNPWSPLVIGTAIAVLVAMTHWFHPVISW